MLILPIGHEHTSVRRLPWVTFTVMAVCVVAFLLTLISPATEARVTDRQREALRYYFDHPYLSLDQHLVSYEYYAFLREGGGPSPTAPDRRRLFAEQHELDRLTALVFAAIDDMPYYRWGLIPSRIRPLAVLTHMFMHGGWMHLLGNLFILYLVGPFIEDIWGRPLYASFYVVGGVFAGLFFAFRYPDLDGPLIGASGAIAAVMGAFAWRYFRTKITFFYFFFFFFRIFHGTFQAPAWLMLGLWFLRELMFAFGWWAAAGIGGGGGVAYWAHVYGFVFGLGVAWAVARLEVEERFIHPAIEAKRTVYENLTVERALDLARSGRSGEAMARLRGELDSNPEDLDAAAALWSLAGNEGMAGEVAPRLLPALRRAVRDGDVQLLSSYWPDVLRLAPDFKPDLALSVRSAEMLRTHGALEDAAETVEWIASHLPSAPPPALLVRLARVASELHLQQASVFAALARQDPSLTPTAAAELDRLGVEPAPSGDLGQGWLSATQPARAVLKVVEASPLRLSTDALELEVDGSRRRLPLAQVKAVGLARIERPQPPRLIVDLFLDRPTAPPTAARTVRLSAGFDPRALVGGNDAVEALQLFLIRLAEGAGAPVLPGGASPPAFATVADYERGLLGGA
jgi:membrane associated rhomboid family serine protease